MWLLAHVVVGVRVIFPLMYIVADICISSILVKRSTISWYKNKIFSYIICLICRISLAPNYIVNHLVGRRSILLIFGEKDDWLSSKSKQTIFHKKFQHCVTVFQKHWIIFSFCKAIRKTQSNRLTPSTHRQLKSHDVISFFLYMLVVSFWSMINFGSYICALFFSFHKLSKFILLNL